MNDSRAANPPSKAKRRTSPKILTLAVLLLTPILLLASYLCLYEPLKFHFLIRKIETADTAAEERRAFELASRWGDIWEVSPADSHSFKGKYQSIQAARALIRIEWLESRFYNGRPYQAYRAVIETNNIALLR